MSLFTSALNWLAGDNAAKAQEHAADRALNIQKDQYNQTRGDLAPYRDTGSTALSQYRDIIGLNGQDAAKTALSQYTESPALPGLVQRTQQAVDGSAAARGGLFSGATAQAIGDRTGQLYLQDYDNYLSRLRDTAGLGEQAAAQTGQFGANAANQEGNYATQIGQFKAQRALGPAQAWQQFSNDVSGGLGRVGAFG